mmetsp:Transcript_97321/g.275734  ORF Transcript_97321/g.275734 Transcript_97321/m.275734 type:complete len:374 (-) Transcript_97321:109-1230(-)
MDGRGGASRGLGGFPPPGKTMTGMVKSYNRKGFGFIMCQALDQDIYFARDNLHPQLQTSASADLAGENVTFEVHRFPDGKLQARNLRAVGDVSSFKGYPLRSAAFNAKGGKGAKGGPILGGSAPSGRVGDDEDRSRDWHCDGCGERNFVKRSECYKCRAPRPRTEGVEPAATSNDVMPRRALSPHAGSRAMREMFRKGGGAQTRTRGKGSRSRSRKKDGRKRGCSKTSGTSSGSSRSKRKSRSRRRKHSKSRSRNRAKRRSRSRSSGSSSSGSSSGSSKRRGGTAKSATTAAEELTKVAEGGEGAKNPEVEKAKAEVLEKMIKLRDVQPKEARVRDWRALLREWHPDKNPDRVEVATAVFQFLQKGKLLLEAT